jgi:hypothetical protein
MVGNFTALALALVIAALIASAAVGIYAFEIFTLIRERVIRGAANTGGWSRPLHVVSARRENAAVTSSRNDENLPASGYQPAPKKRSSASGIFK